MAVGVYDGLPYQAQELVKSSGLVVVAPAVFPLHAYRKISDLESPDRERRLQSKHAFCWMGALADMDLTT